MLLEAYVMEEKQYKKFYRKADKHLNGKIEAKNGMGNSPMVGATVAVAVAIEESAK